MKIPLTIRLFVLRWRLHCIGRQIETLEDYRRRIGPTLDALLREATQIRAELWYTENPRPPAGTTLRGLNVK